MKLFEVTNGYTGESYVKVFTTAISESDAIGQAREVYKKEHPTNENAWSNLCATVLCDDTSMVWASEVRDY